MYSVGLCSLIYSCFKFNYDINSEFENYFLTFIVFVLKLKFFFVKFRNESKEDLDVAEFKHSYILQRIECLKKSESQNLELSKKLLELDENERVIKQLSKIFTI